MSDNRKQFTASTGQLHRFVVKQKSFYYAMIDGTSAVDSVAFGTALEASGGARDWGNLLDLLDPDSSEPGRLVDPMHDFLPIYKLRLKGSSAVKDAQGVAAICPGGLNGLGADKMWQNYNGGKFVDFPDYSQQLLGRHAGAELSASFIQKFILEPVVEVNGARKQIVSGSSKEAKGTLFRASLLYLSSHGWLGGFSRGDSNPSNDSARPLPPSEGADDPREEYNPWCPYFVVGKFDVKNKAFRGPEWLVLAQCSTVNNATWAMWARVMARSSPQVRGVLGYEEASPAANASILIAQAFFKNLEKKMTFYEAWKSANPGQNWAALIHQDAMRDTLGGWGGKPALSGKTVSMYLGSASRAKEQVPINDPPLPCTVRVLHVYVGGGKPDEITPDVLDEFAAELTANDSFTVEITHSKLTQVTVQWIHIRDTFQQFFLKKIFSKFTSDVRGATLSSTEHSKVLVVTLPTPQSTVSITFTAHDKETLKRSGLVSHHSYLWPRIHVTGEGLNDVQFDLKARGLAYYD